LARVADIEPLSGGTVKRGMASPHIADRYRSNAHDRGYDRRWKRAVKEFLWRRQWCVGCMAIGVRRRATTVDHVVPHKGDRALFWDSTNWQACCEWHHNSVKAELERLFAAGQLRRSELHLGSPTAVALTRSRHRPAVGPDGFAIPGT